MAYVDRPNDYISERAVPVVAANYHDQVRWGPIIAGLVVALSTQLVLSALGVAVGAGAIGDSGAPRTDAGSVSVNVGIWSIISLLLSLFVGGWMAARTAGRMNRNTALLNGAILWASTLALSAWLLSSGVSGAFGVAASNAGSVVDRVQQTNPNVTTAPGQVAANAPKITAQQTRDIAGNTSKVSWSFVFGSLLGLIASLFGSAVGVRQPRITTIDRE
ncbi:hypothetical protein [Chamaesiphon sp. VAR_48_metabat_403]|uniref:hypothetical protein n=1 Tax=Chamaesiphon sp. VAR_48_metabat_403 TaxID=2964700 RepID=UPI00286E9699|nr:hypothetical protein [Chamaesiphon sp. VAR_48_metabat_403]